MVEGISSTGPGIGKGSGTTRPTGTAVGEGMGVGLGLGWDVGVGEGAFVEMGVALGVSEAIGGLVAVGDGVVRRGEPMIAPTGSSVGDALSLGAVGWTVAVMVGAGAAIAGISATSGIPIIPTTVAITRSSIPSPCGPVCGSGVTRGC